MAKSTGSKITEKVIKDCRDKLLKSKMDLLNRVKEAREKLDLGEINCDEVNIEELNDCTFSCGYE